MRWKDLEDSMGLRSSSASTASPEIHTSFRGTTTLVAWMSDRTKSEEEEARGAERVASCSAIKTVSESSAVCPHAVATAVAAVTVGCTTPRGGIWCSAPVECECTAASSSCMRWKAFPSLRKEWKREECNSS